MSPERWREFMPLVIALPFILLMMRRNMKARRLRVELMWIRPAILLLVGGLALSQTTPPGPLMAAAMALGFAGGVGLGWLRGRHTRISVDPETHEATYQASPAAMAVILALLVVRFGGRIFLQENALSLHIDLLQATDVLLLLAVGMVAAQQLEMWIRARGLIADSKAAKLAREPELPAD